MWARIINALLGIWLMAAPAVLDYGGLAATNHRIVGPIAASLAIIAIWEIARPLRWANLPLGLWLIVSPLALGGASVAAITSLLSGVALALLALVRGKVEQQVGGGWSALWRVDEQERQAARDAS
jgi:hypothetical protein